MIAALFVDRKGPYFDHPACDPWDETRDARGYEGPFPVIAHPPCAAWCRWAALRERDGFGARGDDDGAFAAALAAVRTYGGVLEHPKHSAAWAAFGLPEPIAGGLWQADVWGGWACEIDQAEWGLAAHKPTWLYFVGASPPVLSPTHDASGASRAEGLAQRTPPHHAGHARGTAPSGSTRLTAPEPL